MKTLLDKYYDFTKENSELPVEEQIVFSILADLNDRCGLTQEWESILEETQEEIIQTWINIVKEKIKT